MIDRNQHLTDFEDSKEAVINYIPVRKIKLVNRKKDRESQQGILYESVRH